MTLIEEQGTPGVTVAVFRPSGATDSAALRTARRGRVLYDSGVVGAGGVCDSGVLDLTGIESLYIIADNVGGGATRAITMDTFLDNGTTNVDPALVLRTVAIGARERGAIGMVASGALGTPAMTFSFPISLPTKAQLKLVAGGTGNGRLTVFGR